MDKKIYHIDVPIEYDDGNWQERQTRKLWFSRLEKAQYAARCLRKLDFQPDENDERMALPDVETVRACGDLDIYTKVFLADFEIYTERVVRTYYIG